MSIVALRGTNLLVEELRESGWESDEGSSGVKYDTSVLELSSGVTKGNRIEINFPVGLASQWNCGDLSCVVILIDTAKGSLRLVTLIIRISKVEGENGVVQDTLLHHVVKWRRDLVYGDGVVSKTQDTIESTECEGKTWLFGSFGEDLVLNLKVSNTHDILGNVSAKASRAISNLEGGPVLLVCGRGR